MHARALLSGAPYSDIAFLHSPYTTLVAPVAEPPALPVLIAAVFAAAGESLAPVRLLLVLSLALFALVVWRYWRRLEGDAVAGFVAAWSVIALTRLHVVDTVLADIPFAAAFWLTLLLAERSGASARAGAWRRYLALALAGALAFSFRMAALPLLPAILCLVFLRPARERRALALLAAFWSLSALGVLFLLPGASALGSEVPRGASEILQDLWRNVRAILEGAQTWVPVALPWRAANIVLQGSMLLPAAIGAVLALREHPRRFAYIAGAWYLAMLLVLPTRAARYMWPLYPLLTFAFIRGGGWLLRNVASGPRLRPLAPALGVLLLLLGALQDAFTPAPRTWDREPELLQVVDLLRREATADATRPRVVFFSPRVLTWETGMTTTVFGKGGSAPDALFNELLRQRITHVVVGDGGTDVPGTAETAAMVSAHSEAFNELLVNEQFTLYEVRRR